MKLTEAEWIVMNVVWERRSVVAREVLEAVEDRTGWAYTTVKTLMSRLVDKGALKGRKRGNTVVFEPVISREQARRSAVRGLLDRAFDGAFGSFVQHMLTQEKLSSKDRLELERMLAELEPRPPRSGKEASR